MRCARIRRVFCFALCSIEMVSKTYALYVWRLCKTINYNILYIKYVERILSSVCVLSKYIMRHTSNPNEKILQKNVVLVSRNMILHKHDPDLYLSLFLSISLSFHHIFNLFIYLTVLASFSFFLFFVFYAYTYITRARSLLLVYSSLFSLVK